MWPTGCWMPSSTPVKPMDTPDHSFADLKKDFVTILEDLSQYLKYQQSLGNHEHGISGDAMARVDLWGTPAWLSHGFAGQGPDSASIVIVDSEGNFFDGPAGELLVKILRAMHLTPSQVYICNTADMVRVRSHIRSHTPKCILTLGEKAGQLMLGTKDGLEGFRGSFFEFSGTPLMPTYHPTVLLKDPQLKRQVWDDVQQVMAQAGL